MSARNEPDLTTIIGIIISVIVAIPVAIILLVSWGAAFLVCGLDKADEELRKLLR